MSPVAAQYYVETRNARYMRNTTGCGPKLLHISTPLTYTQAQNDTAEHKAALPANSLPIGSLQCVVLKKQGNHSFSVGIRGRCSTSPKQTVDSRMPNSKKVRGNRAARADFVHLSPCRSSESG